MDQMLTGASLNVRDGLILNTGNNLNLVASDVNVGGDAVISAGNSINILSAAEVDTEYSFYEKTNYLTDTLKAMGTIALAATTGGASLLVVNDGVDVNCSGGSCGASAQIGSQTKDESFTKNTTSIGSAINVGGDLNMNADKDINIVGSEIAVGGSGIVSAVNNINVLESQNTAKTSMSHSDTTITAGVSVGNSYVDAALATKALYDAGDAVVKAAEALKQMKDLRAAGQASDDAVRDAEFNLTMANLNLVNAEIAAVSSVAGSAAAAGSSFATGMYASGSLNFETNKNFMDSTSTGSVVSMIDGTNITLNTGNDLMQSGSYVSAEDTVKYQVGGDLNVLASTDTYKTTSGSENITAGVSAGNNAVQVNAGYNTSKNKSSGTSHNNSGIAGNTVIIETVGDATFAGANVRGDEIMEMNVGGDLNVESKQDSDYANGSNFGVNIGGGNSSVNTGFNVGGSNHDSMWVNDLTELTGSNVNINVDGKTTLTGAMIAAGEYDENSKFVDNGNLNLATNEIEYNNIKDFNNSNTTGFGFSTGVGGNTDAGISNLHPSGSTTISITDTGSESEQINRATIGGGILTITNNSDTVGLNRDVSVSQEVTKELITGVLDNKLIIDNRVLSGNGWDSIKTDHEIAVDTILTAGDYIVEQTGKIIDDIFKPDVVIISKTYESLSIIVNNYENVEALTLGGQTNITKSYVANGYYSLCTDAGTCSYFPVPFEEPGLESVMAPWEIFSLGKAGWNLASVGIKSLVKTVSNINPLKGTSYSTKVIEQMNKSDDLYHAFPSAIDDFTKDAKITKITGGDGILRTKIELPGSINGKSGNYEWIIEPNKIIKHRKFETK